ncbi:hypothetical protein DFH08DRAFT_1086017 [Mycena albidolilacea]|uniref:F-box domain-containing protein n=1 Tax=Mycena albidolilacea TaxID=1033008 RepID=A0AAD6ZFF4_9AGAR|nr:hypothetical protein DFH08DRAFT_1086017 [Mycena albidolilacea]
MTRTAEASATLRSRLEAVLSDIAKQKEIIKKIEGSTSARLPRETASEIFIHCLPPSENTYKYLRDPLLLLGICTRWSEIALSTPQLWANLCVEIPAEVTSEFVNYLNGWLSRAKESPLSLSFTGCHTARAEIIGIVAGRAHHIFPCLKSLRVTRVLDDKASPPAANATLQVLRSAPGLVASLFNLEDRPRRSMEPGECVHHGRLTTLVIEGIYEPSAHILEGLRLPALEHLRVTIHSGNTTELISFLTRSSSCLNYLSINGIDQHWDRNSVERCFALVPCLTSLDLTGHEDFHNIVIALLTCGPCEELLPDLFGLTMTREWTYHPDATWYKPLTAMLSGRRRRLRSFRVKWVRYGVPKPDEDDKRVVRELMEEGMEIDLGIY